MEYGRRQLLIVFGWSGRVCDLIQLACIELDGRFPNRLFKGIVALNAVLYEAFHLGERGWCERFLW